MLHEAKADFSLRGDRLHLSSDGLWGTFYVGLMGQMQGVIELGRERTKVSVLVRVADIIGEHSLVVMQMLDVEGTVYDIRLRVPAVGRRQFRQFTDLLYKYRERLAEYVRVAPWN